VLLLPFSPDVRVVSPCVVLTAPKKKSQNSVRIVVPLHKVKIGFVKMLDSLCQQDF